MAGLSVAFPGAAVDAAKRECFLPDQMIHILSTEIEEFFEKAGVFGK